MDVSGIRSALRAEITLDEDIAVPRSTIVELVASVRSIPEQHGVSATLLAPIGGNVRVTLTDLKGDGRLPDRAWTAADALVRRALELCGTITGEQGIGLLKHRWLHEELGDVQYELQRGLKRYSDPSENPESREDVSRRSRLIDDGTTRLMHV